jgi:hypothetical protein
MKAILMCIGFGILAANIAAIGAGTRQGIGGMLTIDALCVAAVCVIGTIWLAHRMGGPARKAQNRYQRVQIMQLSTSRHAV